MRHHGWTFTLALFAFLALGGCFTNSDGESGTRVDAGEPNAHQTTDTGANSATNSPDGDPDTGVEDAESDAIDSTDAGEDGGDSDPPPVEECENWADEHPEWIWCDGFEDLDGWQDGYGDVNDDDGRFAPSEDDAFAGSRSLQQLYTEGQVGAGWLGFHLGDAPGASGEPARDHYFVRWYHKFEEGFEDAPPKMARVRRLSPGWDKEYSVHHWIGDDDHVIVADVHAPDSTQANDAGWLPVTRSDFSYDDENVGRWICHEMEIRNNTPGDTDGHVRVWADGELIIERTEVDLRGDRDDADLNEIMLDTYWNGGSPTEQSRYYDNFVVSTERVGCL